MVHSTQSTQLIEFSVTNYRSIKDTVTLSMIAPGKIRKNTFYCETIDAHVLKSAVLFGANASGKSNLHRALRTLVDVLLGTKRLFSENDGHSIDPQPFLLDDISRESPTVFSLELVSNNTQYIYVLALETKSETINSESLHVKYPDATSPSLIFSRSYNDFELTNYIPLSRHKISRKYFKSVEARTPFVTTLSRLQLDTPTVASEFLDAVDELTVINTLRDKERTFKALGDFLDYSDEVEHAVTDGLRNTFLRVLNDADTSIVALDVRTDDSGAKNIYVTHRYVTDDAKIHNVSFPLYEESEGTRKLLSMVVPIIKSTSTGTPLIADELDSTIHPVLLRYIIRKFNQASSSAQLFMTSHDVTLMDDRSLLTLDQIMFIERKKDQSSDLYCLSDFTNIRNENRNLSKRYLAGEFGANPKIVQDIEDA